MDNSCHTSDGQQWPAPLRRMDQLCIAVLLAAALVSMAGYWLAKGGHRGRLIEIDRAAPLHAQFAVDVNTAEWPELAQLPGVGEILARRIVEHRKSQGNYLGKQEMLKVHGIGPRTLERIEPYLLPLPERTNVAGLKTPGVRRGRSATDASGSP